MRRGTCVILTDGRGWRWFDTLSFAQAARWCATPPGSILCFEHMTEEYFNAWRGPYAAQADTSSA